MHTYNSIIIITVIVLATLILDSLVASQTTGHAQPLAQPCHTNLPRVVCINKYAAVMPPPFVRPFSGGNVLEVYDFVNTAIPNEKSFALTNSSDFLVFDRQSGLDILGQNPNYKLIYKEPGNHEACVYVPGLNKVILQRLVPGNLPQHVIDLNQNPPALRDNYIPDPPIFAPVGAAYHRGLIYFTAAGSTDNTTLGGGTIQRAGIKTLDPITNKSTTLLNNYFGIPFTGPDDLIVHPVTGDVWFTETSYAFATPGFSVTRPQLKPATYRFTPSTGAVQIVEDTLELPNGVALSPNLKTLYIGDSGALSGSIVTPSGLSYNTTGKRTIYAYDVSPNGTYITNKRAIHLVQSFVPDGIRVARNGYIIAAAGQGVDVLDARGTLLVRVQTSFSVQCVVFAGKNLTELWVMGNGAIARVQWALQGLELK